MRHLKPIKKKKIKFKNIFGFDIETQGRLNDFLLCSIYGDKFRQIYESKAELIHSLTHNPIFRDCIIFATNLGFDFLGTFKDDLSGFSWMLRGSDFIFAKTYIYDGKFNKTKRKSKERILFLDSRNFYKSSLADMGKIIGFNKMHYDFNDIRKPTGKRYELLKEYNLRDSEITYKFMRLLFDNFSKLGISPQYTIAGTAMSYFKSHFLKKTYFSKDTDDVLAMFEGYYGGRTETFCRGKINDARCYDINSLYPSVMINEFPDPNSMKTRLHGTVDYINNFEGQSYIEAFCPDGILPLLPMRYDNKLLFPKGYIKGSYCHNEIRKALELGYIITRIGKQYYFRQTCRPFDGYVTALYDLRKATNKKDFMNIVYKLLLNSLYGKFAQKFMNKSGWHYNNFTAKELRSFDYVETIGEFVRLTRNNEPASFCIPIWASYVTAYGRIKLYEYLCRYDPIACDTDSIFTRHEIADSDELGKMKFAGFAKEAIFVRPKFYCFGADVVLKGCPIHLDKKGFMKILEGDPVKNFKFLKLAEAIRRNKGFNERIEMIKKFDLEDNKREWPKRFDLMEMQESEPLKILESGFTKKDILAHNQKIMAKMHKQKIADLKHTDFFDSKGDDITDDEFMKNEISRIFE